MKFLSSIPVHVRRPVSLAWGAITACRYPSSAAASFSRSRLWLFGVRWLLVAAGADAILAGWTSAAPGSPLPGPGVFFVATNGNDQWSGKLAAPNGERTDGPFATPIRARDAVREYKRQRGGAWNTPIKVFIRRGLHFLREPFVLASEDSGTVEQRVEYVAFPGERPVLSGGRRISGWKATEVNGRPLWAAQLPDAHDGEWCFRQIWVNGERRTRARHPNKGYLAVDEIPDAKPEVPWSQGQSRFRFKAGDLRAWPTATNAEVRVMNRWVESHLPIARVDEDERMLMFTKRSVFKLDAGDLYYVEHALELLDAPGEWYLDRAAGKLYYWPQPGEDLVHAEVVAPVLAQVVRLEGKPEAGQFIQHLAFRDLTCAHTEWNFPGGFHTGRDKAEVWPRPAAEVGGFAQAAVGVPGAVWGQGVRDCVFEGCHFVNLGGYALEFARGCQGNRVSRCELGDLGAGGIKLGETAIRDSEADVAQRNEISDCHIYHGGRIFHSAIGVWVGQSPGNRILHNHIHDFYYTGISLGWTWGYGRALATNNVVEFNHVHHIGVQTDGDGPILSDMAGIYTLGLHAGTVIRDNLWHDSAGFRYGGWGIYFDEGTTGILAENNVVYRTTHGGFHQHYGKDNIVRNNVFAFAREWQIQRTRAEAHRSFTFERNVVLWNKGRLLGGNFSGTNYLFLSNLYWPEGDGEPRFDEWSFEEWKHKGQDTNSLIADPMFRDPHMGDFTLAPDSPAWKLGFSPIDSGKVGPRTRWRE